MFVMGTAGHVDHGKSTLVTALSGIDPDRLPEEKARGMTIDLGFAWMTTKSGQTIGIVDVPGHERFVKNMIAGVGAIDFVLLVIAADDGWMPQTAEHLAILRFLRVPRGMAVITKSALVQPDWLDLVKSDVAEHLIGAFPQQAETPVVTVDSLTGDGLDQLRDAIDAMVLSLPPRPDYGKPRLYIDRVFAMTGRGVVVTGTLIDGSIASGQTAAIVPGELTARIRELQIHKQSVTVAAPGQRLAVNLAGVEGKDLSRGQCLVTSADTSVTDRLWAQVSILPDMLYPLESQREVLIMLGTAEPAALAYPLDQAILPGADGLCELRLKEPIKAHLKDRFVLRWPTPQVTIGGGEVLELGGSRRRHRDSRWRLHLKARVDAPLSAFRETELRLHGCRRRSGFLDQAPFRQSDIDADLQVAEGEGRVVSRSGWLFDPDWLKDAAVRLIEQLRQTHSTQPYLAGLNISEWADRADLDADAMDGVSEWLLIQGQVRRSGDSFHLPNHLPDLPDSWRAEATKLWQPLEMGGFQPPLRDELEASSEHARAIVAYWISVGEAVYLGDGVVLTRDSLDKAREIIRITLADGKSMATGQLRELLHTTRRFVVPILEALDREGTTRRVGDERVLASHSP